MVVVNKATVVKDETASMEFELKIDGDAVNIRVTGYSDPVNALKALHLMGQQDILARVIDRYVDASDDE